MSITRTLAKRWTNYDSEFSVGSKLRKRRITPLLEMIESYSKDEVRIIDVGGREQYWNIISRKYLDDHNVTITIVNLPKEGAPKDHGPFRFVQADARNLARYSDGSFDIVHSNSVVEHVGDWGSMLKFAREVRRLAKCYFVQTPNYWFPIEPHCMTPFFHWAPKPLRIWLVSNFQLGHWKKADSICEAVYSVESARLLNKKMLKALFPESIIFTERFFGLPKSFIAIRR